MFVKINRFGERLENASHIVLMSLVLVGAASVAQADMVLSDIIVDLQAPGQMRHDIEV